MRFQKIDLNGFDFTLLRNKEDWQEWSRMLYEPSEPSIFPCIALHISDSEGYDTQIYPTLMDLKEAVNMMESN